MSGLGERDGMLHGFGVANFPDQDDIRRLTQGILESVMPGVRVDSDFAMGDQRLMRLVHEFNGVLHRDDMARRGAIAVIDHGGESGRFS